MKGYIGVRLHFCEEEKLAALAAKCRLTKSAVLRQLLNQAEAVHAEGYDLRLRAADAAETDVCPGDGEENSVEGSAPAGQSRGDVVGVFRAGEVVVSCLGGNPHDSNTPLT